MSQPIASSSLSSPVVGGTGFMDWSGNGLPVTGGKPAQVLLQNESGCGLRVKLRGSSRGFDLPAGGWMQSPLPLLPNETGLDFTILYVLPNQPVGLLLGTYYAPGEIAVGVSLGNSPIGLSGTVSATVENISMDDKPAGTSLIEATPTDQATSAWAMNNDASGFLKVLSANVQRIILNVVRGNTGAGKATVQIGDSGDATITTVYGSIQGGQPANVGILTSTLLQVPVDTTSSNYNAIHLGIDPHTSADWYYIVNINGDVLLFDNKNGRTLWRAILSDGSVQFVRAVSSVGGVTTTGTYGVVLQIGQTKDLNIVNTSLTNVLAVTTPNDGANHDIEVNADLFVGAANTNAGTVTLQVVYTDPHQGALTLFMNVYGQANLINGIAQAKGQGIRCDIRHIRCTPNSTVTVQYKNTAAGTISDFSSAVIKLLS